MTQKKKVAVLLSGGVDSSVAAFLLINQGYNVVALTAKLLESRDDNCIERAKEVAKKLNIPHYTADLSKEFKESVIDSFIETYKRGETPNPCCICNRRIKFGALTDYAINVLGCDYIATGHYSKIVEKNNKFFIFPAKDKNKDQSYFLYDLTQKQLSKVLLPLSDMTKDEIKKLAEQNDLPSKSAKESQDICFIQKPMTTAEFISQHIQSSKGDILLYPTNKKLGEHNGIHKYTLGQRKGLNVSYTEPLYVKDINIESNTIHLSTKSDTLINEVKISNINNFDGINNCKFEANVKIRYNMQERYAKIKIDNDIATIIFKEPVLIQSKGQIAVAYDLDDGHIIIGGTIV